MGRRRVPRRRRRRAITWQGARRLAVVASFGTGLVCAVALWGLWGPALTAFAILTPILSVALLAGVRGWQHSVRISVVGSLGAVAVAGLVGAFGWSGVVVVVLLLATSPALRTLLVVGRASAGAGRPWRWDESPDREDPGTDHRRAPPVDLRTSPGPRLAWLEELPAADTVAGLDDEDLCRAWRRSYLQLDVSAVGVRRLAVVRLREVYLDELTRRHPAEVRQWLASGARAAGNPLPFLRRPVSPGDPDPGADEAWPEP
jgi:hypothetical protein